MAKTKEQKEAELMASQKDTTPKTASKIAKPAPETKSGPSYDELIMLVQQLSNEVAALKATPAAQASQAPANDNLAAILDIVSNKKADKEVIIVHNREMAAGLTTHIELNNLSIDFRTIGEQRILNWQQFEECVSKYRSFFLSGILSLGEDHEDLAERYGVPCVKSTDSYHITRKDLDKLPNLSSRELEDFINKLDKKDKEFIYSYWLGKCYTKEPGFYDRAKVEMLGRLSENDAFANFMALMNGDFREEVSAK